MKRILLIAAIGLLAAIAAPAPGVAGDAGSWLNWDSGLRQARSQKRPVLVDVYTDWCGWCKRMDREVYSRRDVQDYLSRRFVTVRLNAESNEAANFDGKAYTARTLAARFGVTGYPTTIFLSARGGHLGSVPGYLPADQFLLMLRFVGEGHLEKGEKFEDFARAAGGAGAARR